MPGPKFQLQLFGFALALAFFTACGKGDGEPPTLPEPGPLKLAVDTDKTYQAIAGFGGANRMWGMRFLKPDEAQTAFGLDEGGLGLSTFRARIASNEAEWPLILEAAQAAQSHGVKIIASPWPPPAELKSNNSDIGGHLPEENFEAFKDHITNMDKNKATAAVEICH